MPYSLLRKARLSGREYAWRRKDVEEVIRAGAEVGLRCLGGQVQYLPPDGTCEAWWLNYDARDRMESETWGEAAARSAEEVVRMFRRVCKESDFSEEARKFAFLQTKMDEEDYDPVEDMWFMLYFETEPST